MPNDPEVEAWFDATKPPAEDLLRRARDTILGADKRIGEYVKYGNVNFGYKGDLCSFVQAKGKTVSIMVHRGARIPGTYAHLEGTGASARHLRFDDTRGFLAREKELARIVVAWCDMMDAGGPDAVKRTVPKKAAKKTVPKKKKAR